MRNFPALEPYKVHSFRVGGGHILHVEESGNPEGIPVVFVHGGPGSGTSPKYRRRFNPKLYRIIGFDQRGCGKSTPFAETKHNTTWDLVADMEKIRMRLKVDRWLVTGGSWGSTLSLAYAQSFPERVMGLIMWGIYLGRRAETAWFFDPMGLPRMRWAQFVNLQKALKTTETGRKMELLLHAALHGKNNALARTVAVEWCLYEGGAATVNANMTRLRRECEADVARCVAMARLETHYFMNDCWLKPNQLLKGVKALRGMGVTVIQGGVDLVCPPQSALELVQALPKAKLVMVAEAGHSNSDGLEQARLKAYAEFARKFVR